MDKNLSKKSEDRGILLHKKILVLRAVLMKIEKLNLEDRIRFYDLIGGICVFLENELDPELH